MNYVLKKPTTRRYTEPGESIHILIPYLINKQYYKVQIIKMKGIYFLKNHNLYDHKH